MRQGNETWPGYEGCRERHGWGAGRARAGVWGDFTARPRSWGLTGVRGDRLEGWEGVSGLNYVPERYVQV